MKLCRDLLVVAIGILVVAVVLAQEAAEKPRVTVSDSGFRTNSASWECTAGHTIQTRDLTLGCGATSYRFHYSGCLDPSHGEKRPSSEGNFGMPVPARCNWYAAGFINILINGENAVAYRLADMRVLDSGERGACQAVWEAPDATVGLRLLLLPGENHVLGLLQWRPRAGKEVKTVQVRLTAYPSFFTTALHRVGERHVLTPRIGEKEGKTLTLDPAQDTWLYLYDKVFDLARGEGEGPCAALVAPEGVSSGTVQIGGYAVVTILTLKPEAGQARLGFYDFCGQTNAAAEEYLRKHGAEDVKELQTVDFRPLAVQRQEVAALRAEADKLIAAAGEDGQAQKPKFDALFTKLTTLQEQATAGDWQAEAALAEQVQGSQDMFWKLRIFALLNQP